MDERGWREERTEAKMRRAFKVLRRLVGVMSYLCEIGILRLAECSVHVTFF